MAKAVPESSKKRNKFNITSILAQSFGVFVSLAIGYLLCEVGYRLLTNEPLLAFKDYRTERTILSRLNSAATFDDRLGWRLRENVNTETLKTIDHGIRRNGPTTVFEPEAILAVGDSFTAGSEVDDHESWPAFLERRLEYPVMNAGVGGYGTDQIILRAEGLLEKMNPRAVVVSFLQDDILRAGYSSYGRPKPFYTLDGDEIRYNPPAANDGISTGTGVIASGGAAIRTLLGYSALADRLMIALAPSFWFGSAEQVFTRIANDEVFVTCALLQRFKARVDAEGIRFILFMQYGGGNVARDDRPAGYAQLVIECARDMGIQVVDHFPVLKGIADGTIEDLKALYVMRPDGRYGHMSAAGNDNAAELLAKAIREPAPDLARNTSRRSQNREPMPVLESIEETIGSSSIVNAEPIRDHVRITAIGGKSEHYAGLPRFTTPAGPTTLTLDVKQGGTPHVRVQLLDSKSNGVIVDVDLDRSYHQLHRISLVRRPTVTLSRLSWGWQRLVLSGDFPERDRSVIIQLHGKDGQSVFLPDGENVTIRDVHLR